MKRIIFFCIFIFLIFLISNVTAISSNLKTEYERGESIIIEINGNILEPIDKTDVEFLRKHISVPLEYDIKKIGGRYFLWAIAPQTSGNYTLAINNIATTISGKTARINFAQNFSVMNNLTDYSIKPGFISTKEDFIISIDLNADFEKIINVNRPYEREVVLKPGRNNVEFLADDFDIGGEVKPFVMSLDYNSLEATIFSEDPAEEKEVV